MRAFSILILAGMLTLPTVAFGHTVHVDRSKVHRHESTIKHDHKDNNPTCIFGDEVRNFSFKHNTVIITYSEGVPEELEINDRHELYVDGKRVNLNGDQQKLVGEFYEKIRELIDDAKEVGLEGAGVGLQGAKVAVKAMAGVFAMLCTSYTSDDLERDMERESAKIEHRAAELEAKASKIEDRANEAERLYEKMEESIPELHRGI